MTEAFLDDTGVFRPVRHRGNIGALDGEPEEQASEGCLQKERSDALALGGRLTVEAELDRRISP